MLLLLEAYHCPWYMQIPVHLKTPYGCTTMQYGNTSTQEGMLEVCNSGTWKAVCNRFYCGSEGKAACKQLGYGGSKLSKCMEMN